MQRLELGPARRDLGRVVALAERSGDAQVKAWGFMAQHNRGYAEFLAGNLPEALRLMDAAAALPVRVSRAVANLDKARVLIEAGMSDVADEALRAAESEFRRARLSAELGETELARAEAAVLVGDLRSARALAASARNRFRRRGDHRWRRVAELALLSADLADRRPAQLLVDPALRLAGEFAAHGLRQQARTAELVACAALGVAGRLEQAEERLGRLGRVPPRDPVATRLQQRLVTADLMVRRGRIRQARAVVRSGVGQLSRHQAQFGSIDLQTGAAIHGRGLVRLDLELALASRSPAALFAAIERGRAVSRRLSPLTPPTDESAPLLTELRSLSEELRAVGDDASSRTEAERLRRRSADLRGQLSAISWRSVGVGAVSRPATVTQVRRAVADLASTLVSYCQLDGRWSAVVAGPDRIRLVDLPGDAGTVELVRRALADLDVLALDAVPDPLRASARGSLRAALDQLDRLLIAPLHLDSERVVVVPTGPTSTLPWGCLPGLRGRGVEVAPTATSWLWGLRVADRGAFGMSAFAGPDLRRADLEVTGISRLWGVGTSAARSYTGAATTRRRLAESLGTDTVVHVAAHGRHLRQSPLFSSLQLSDGPLFAYEIADSRVPGHVVLSACELGQVTTRAGDEALGLARVLLQLGSRCVVAGVARVNDEVAERVMVDYHRRLVAGQGSAAALAAAIATERDPVPFVCFGSSWQHIPDSAEDGPGQHSAARTGPVRTGRVRTGPV